MLCRMNEKAVSKSISMPQDLWDKVEVAHGFNNEDRSEYFRRLATIDLRKLGLLGEASDLSDIIDLVQEAMGMGIPVRAILKSKMKKELVV